MAAPKRTYAEKLRDTRWQEKRLILFKEANWTCEECGKMRPADGLEIHHIFYLTGASPWEYPDHMLMVLCGPCHEKRQPIEQAFFLNVAKVLRNKSMEEIQNTPAWWMFETKPFYPKGDE